MGRIRGENRTKYPANHHIVTCRGRFLRHGIARYLWVSGLSQSQAGMPLGRVSGRWMDCNWVDPATQERRLGRNGR